MRPKVITLSLAILALLGGTSHLPAVELTLQPVIRELQNPDFTPLDPQSITVFNPNQVVHVAEGTGPLTVVVDYYVSIAGLAGAPLELGFGNVAFNVLPFNIDLDLSTGGWNPDATLVDTNGDLPDGMEAIWADNGDYGPSGTDLVSIVAGVSPGAFGAVGVDPRRTIGQAAPALVGTTYFNWTPAADLAGGLNVNVTGFSTYTTNMQLRERLAGSKIGGSLQFQVGAGQTGDTDLDGDVDLNDLNNVRNNFESTGEGVPGDTAPYDGVVNLDDLNRVRGSFGESVVSAGGLTAVPEPSTVGLAVCGLIALAGYKNRRRYA